MRIRKKIKDVKLMAVVKADAYGHGVINTVKYLNTLKKFKPEYYGVAFPEEALELRKNNINSPLLVFGTFDKENAGDCLQYNLIATVFTKQHLNILSSELKKSGLRKRIKVHVKVDTGMNRLGINYNETHDYILSLSKNKNFIIDGVYTNFASADSDLKFTMLQLRRFNSLISRLKESNVNCGLLHTANSAAVFNYPDTHLDMVRCGISLYGYHPSFNKNKTAALKPVMSLVSEVSSVKKIKQGETVSYGRTFKASKETNIVSVPVGYADGYSRGLSNKSFALINGKFYKQAGIVTMDRIMFDVGNDNIKVGQKVILLGKDKNKSITAWDWAKTLNTIPYEITCGITKRLPRVYIK